MFEINVFSQGFFLLLCLKLAVCDLDLQSEESVVRTRYNYDNQCEQLPDGAYPDYYQACRMFFICSSGAKVATFWCTKGYVFSLATGHCEPPDRAICPDVDHPTYPTPADLIAEDCITGNGVYPNFNEGCSSFFICQGGVKTTFRCPDSLIFDWKTKSCRAANSHSCGKLSCESKDDGIYVDSSSFCKRYFQCKSGNISEFICPDGTIYNTRHRRCTRSAVTRCPGSDAAQCAGIPDGYYPDFAADCKAFGLCMNGGLKTYNCPAKTAFNPKSLTCEFESQCSKPNVNVCIGKPNGIHANLETGCQDFYMCLDGLLTHYGSCPQRKLLDPRSGNCQPSSMVTCAPVHDNDCARLQDGVYPDYDTGCSAYFVCLSGRRVSTSYCPNNQLYDIATRKCLPSSFVLCRERNLVSPPRLLDTYNCDNRLGVFPEFSSDCHRFVTCAYGEVKYYNCSSGATFDTETNSCKSRHSNCKAPFAVATFQCLPGDDGVYVGGNCSEWHECRNGIGFTNICPKGMYYDIEKAKCVINIESCSVHYKTRRRELGSSSMAATELRNSDFDCNGKTNGVYPDANSCRSFHFCIGNKRTSYSCPMNYSFSEDTGTCLSHSSSDPCRVSAQRNMDKQLRIFTCDSQEDGMYPDYSSYCRRYFVCENGNTIPVYCPERQKFNTNKMMCDREENVYCSPERHQENARKYTRQSDDVYHVYGPEELHSENTGYSVRNRVTTASRTTDGRTLDDDVYSLEEKSGSTRQISDNPNSSNYIPNGTSSKRQYLAKTHTTAPSSINTQRSATTDANVEPTKNSDGHEGRSVKFYQVRAFSRDLDAACRKEDTGFFPDYESGCRLFHICFRTIRKTYSCPSVLLFNPETKNCDLPENVACVRPEPILKSAFNCRASDFVPDYQSGCRKYVGCINNLPYRFSCPKGKIFSYENSICEGEGEARCDFPGAYNDTDPSIFADGTERSNQNVHVHGIPGHFNFNCAEKEDGFYPDFTRHCHVFYRCIKGKKFSHYCKQGLLFNPKSGICDFEENVVCSQDTRNGKSD